MALDVEITQSTYWGGSQIPYWLYMLFVIFPVTGVLGVDHLLLRSPITALLKFLSFVPLFGFWYFYDIAQLGEGSTIKEHGIGIPFYGPGNIGKGMFHDPAKGKGGVSPEEKPRPWMFAGYVLTTILFIAFPVNKLIIGDYYGALAQLCMLLFAPLAIAWSIYDIYRIVSKTRDVIEKTGTARIPPASFLIDGYFKKAMDVLGPKPSDPEPPGILGTAANLLYIPVKAAADSAAGVVKGAAGVVTAAEGAAESAVGAVGAAADAAKNVAKAASGAAGAVSAVSAIQTRVPGALDKALKGGAMISNDPSSTTVLVLFGVALLAFSGYAFTAMRKITKANRDKDDSPPNPATAGRVTSTEE